MLKKRLDNLLKTGVLQKDEYDLFFKTMRENERGELIGVVPPGNVGYKYHFNGDLLQGDPLNFLIKYCAPPLGAESMDPIFYKYGTTISGICDGWYWFTKDNITERAENNGHRPIEEATEIEIWKMIAICCRYWESFYEECYDKHEKELRVYTNKYGRDLLDTVNYNKHILSVIHVKEDKPENWE